MSRSTSERLETPLLDFLLLVLIVLLAILDRLFVDFLLQGTKGARTVVRLDRDSCDEVPGRLNNSWGYTGSTGAGVLGTPAGIWADLGVTGPNKGLGALASWP